MHVKLMEAIIYMKRVFDKEFPALPPPLVLFPLKLENNFSLNISTIATYGGGLVRRRKTFLIRTRAEKGKEISLYK